MRDFTDKTKIHFEKQIDCNGYSYTVIFGSHINGGFIAIPNWEIACEASDSPYNVGYNTSKLTAAGLNEAAAETISQVIDDWLMERTDKQEKQTTDEQQTKPFLTPDMCLNDSKGKVYTNQLLIVDPNVLSEKYKNAEYQLFFAQAGFGCNPDSMGTKVFGQFITENYSEGSSEQMRRSDFLGIADLKALPEWALKKWNDYEDTVLSPVIQPDDSRK